MRRLIITMLCVAAAYTANAQSIAEITNDSRLHEMEPDYGFFYGIPECDSIKSCLDRVIAFVDKTMPAKTEADGKKLSMGGFRMSSYEMGVLYSAAIDAAGVTGDRRYSDFVKDRLKLMAELVPVVLPEIRKDRHYDQQMRMVADPHSLDEAGAMCAAYCRLAMIMPGSSYTGVIRTYMSRINKTYRMGTDRIIARNRPYANSLWLDDMYMGIVPLAWYGCLKHDCESLREAVRQVMLFKKYMWLENKKLFRHGWVEDMNPHPAFAWGRANGWAILTMCQVLDAITVMENDTKNQQDWKDDKAIVTDLLSEHLDGLVAMQHPTGFWHQLLDEGDTYLETSATAIYAYCLAHAICEGWVDAKTYGPRAILAWNAVSRKINQCGEVEDVCIGTGMGFDKAFYSYRPTHVLAAHGYGPVIWAGSEIIRLIRQCKPRMHDSAILF